jgi:hypothetical protein
VQPVCACSGAVTANRIATASDTNIAFLIWFLQKT